MKEVEMRRWKDLSAKEQKQAEEVELGNLLKAILMGMRFDDKANGNTLQAAIDKAIQEAEEMRRRYTEKYSKPFYITEG